MPPEHAEKIHAAAEAASSLDATRLVAAMCEELSLRYGSPASPFEPDEASPPHGAFVIARMLGIAVACGAFRRIDEGVAEVKRMFVLPELRGRGLARCVLAELERLAIAAGYKALRLETGERLPEAIRLYESAGYLRIPAFGSYVGALESVCFEKVL